MTSTIQLNIIKKIKIIEKELNNLKRALNSAVVKEFNSSDILELYGCWEGDIDLLLNELYSRRKRRGRLTDERVSV